MFLIVTDFITCTWREMSCPREGKKGELFTLHQHSFEPAMYSLYLCIGQAECYSKVWIVFTSVIVSVNHSDTHPVHVGLFLWCSLNGVISLQLCNCVTGHHSFELTTFDKPSFCNVCQKLLHGCYFQGYMCSSKSGLYQSGAYSTLVRMSIGCSRAVHRDCLKSVDRCNTMQPQCKYYGI